jgi:hypothetical protein
MKCPTPESARDIEDIARKILKGSRTYGVIPTPVDKIVSYVELRVAQGLSLGGKDQDFFSRTFEGIGRVSRKVLGLLDFLTKTVYVDIEQPVSRVRFVKLHEVGHEACDWQREAYRWDDETTLSPETRQLFEKEASFFASAVLFQLDRFDERAAGLALGLKSAILLARQFDASTHATLRRYVQYSTKRCALLVLEQPDVYPQYGARVRDFFASPSFSKEFGEIDWPEVCGLAFPFITDTISRRRLHEDGELDLRIPSGGIETFEYHYFNNSYNIFVFIKPPGEAIRSRTKIIVATNSDARQN